MLHDKSLLIGHLISDGMYDLTCIMDTIHSANKCVQTTLSTIDTVGGEGARLKEIDSVHCDAFFKFPFAESV